MKSVHITIKENTCEMFGILRMPKRASALMILLSPPYGTRNGPQRIFTEISLDLYKNNIASLCIDLPGNADSYDDNHTFPVDNPDQLINYYSSYIQKIHSFMDENYSFSEYLLLSISIGSIPVLDYAINTNLARVILLSANHEYYEKYLPQFTSSHEQTDKSQFHTKALLIFGENDKMLEKSLDFWNLQTKKDNNNFLTKKIIDEADHSYFGWRFKQEVRKTIIDWINNTP